MAEYLCRSNTLTTGTTDYSSIFTAEAEGIMRALTHIKMSPKADGKFVIFSDSKSVIESVQSQNSNNVTLRELNESIQYIYHHSNKTIEFCWVPSHRKIEGNEKADRAAERARARSPSGLYQIPYTDLYPLVESFVQQKWQDRWENANSTRPNKLFAIQPEVGPLDIHGLTRREETVIHRLRIGHTRLTHSYLMEQRGRFKTPPICKFCKDPDTIMSVEHILIDCPELYYDRMDYYLVPSIKYLFENIPLSEILEFVRKIGIYQEI